MSYAGYGNPFYSDKGFDLNQGMQSMIGQIPGQRDRSLNDLHQYLSMLGQGNMRQAQLGADLYNQDDPMAHSYARMNAEQGARDTTMQGMAGARADSSNQYAQWLQSLLTPYMNRAAQAPNQKKQTTIGYGGFQVGF
jgi:hypothetical protein